MDYSEETSAGATPYEILALAWKESAGGKNELIRFRYALLDFAEDKTLDVWWPRVENSLLYLINRNALLRYFSDLKSLIKSRSDFNFDDVSDPPSPERSGSWRWRRLCVGTFFFAYRFGQTSSLKFWEALREPTETDIPSRGEIPIFSSSQNDILQQYASSMKALLITSAGVKRAQENWVALARKLYRQWYADFQRYYTLIDPADLKAPRYRLGKSLGIGEHQRVFLVSDNEDNPRVVKWDSKTKAAIQNWTLAKDTGMRMIEWSGNYRFSPEIATLLTERLFPLDSTDRPYDVFLQCLAQLEMLHQGGFCHSDIKTDNILRRSPGEYFFIDFDNISFKPLAFASYSLDREVYSPFWVSQLYAKFQPNPTSYRYDLQELFYAIVEHQRTVLSERKKSAGVQPDPNELPIKDFVASEPEATLQDIIDHTHTDQIPGDGYLSQAYTMIMGLPERLPFAQIDHSDLVRFIEGGRESSQQGRVSKPMNCVHCEGITYSRDYSISEEKAACGLRCAVLSGSTVHREIATRMRKYYH